MPHSTITKKGQTTIPGEVRAALGLKTGDRVVYVVDGNKAILSAHPGLRSLEGALASRRGAGLSWATIRARAAASARATGKQK